MKLCANTEKHLRSDLYFLKKNGVGFDGVNIRRHRIFDNEGVLYEREDVIDLLTQVARAKRHAVPLLNGYKTLVGEGEMPFNPARLRDDMALLARHGVAFFFTATDAGEVFDDHGRKLNRQEISELILHVAKARADIQRRTARN